MPFIDIQVSAHRSDDLTARITTMVGDLTSRILHKKPELTAIAIHYVDPRDWSVAGSPLAAQAKSSFFLEIRVTDETNTKDEKAHYIAEIFKGFEALLAPLHEESYVHIHDARAAAYGYGGQTQERRHQAAIR